MEILEKHVFSNCLLSIKIVEKLSLSTEIVEILIDNDIFLTILVKTNKIYINV
jgi:hypothetical protein